jgi:hypothetical protein
MSKPSAQGFSECHTIFDEVTAIAAPGGFDDDFSLVLVHFD